MKTLFASNKIVILFTSCWPDLKSGDWAVNIIRFGYYHTDESIPHNFFITILNFGFLFRYGIYKDRA